MTKYTLFPDDKPTSPMGDFASTDEACQHVAREHTEGMASPGGSCLPGKPVPPPDGYHRAFWVMYHNPGGPVEGDEGICTGFFIAVCD